MKEVTIENVKARIAELEGAGQLIELGLHAEFELACLRRMIELESRCAALAAENAGLKSAINEHSEGFTVCPCCGTEHDSCHDDVCRALNETPATDAFLAEVRAQGVDMFALMFAEEAIKTNNITTGWRARASRAASEYAEALREDAALLRKGVQS